MQKIFVLLIAGFLLVNISVKSQTQPEVAPQIMIFPSDEWCNKKGLVSRVDVGGEQRLMPDYKKAMLDFDLQAVLTKLNEMFQKRGYRPYSLERALKEVDAQSARQMATNMDRQMKGKSGVAETMKEKLQKVAKCDITLNISWNTESTGPQKAIYFMMQATDSYTGQTIADASGKGAPSISSSLTTLLSEAVLNHIDNFNATLKSYFNDLLSGGRKIVVEFYKYDKWDKDFETEMKGDNLKYLIKDWIAGNAKNGAFELIDNSESYIKYNPVVIPYYMPDKAGVRYDADEFGRKIRKFLKQELNIPATVNMIGLGHIEVFCGVDN